jgi:hypothetical protein
MFLKSLFLEKVGDLLYIMSPNPSGEDSTVLISFLALGNYSSFSSNITLLYLVDEALTLGFYSY